MEKVNSLCCGRLWMGGSFGTERDCREEKGNFYKLQRHDSLTYSGIPATH